MFISEISIKNFRLFKDFSLGLNQGLNLIVGANNTGKTALVDAIRYTLDTNSAEWVRVTNKDFHKGESTFKIQLKFDGIEPNQAAVFVEHLTHEPIQGTENRKSVLYVTYEAKQTEQKSQGRPFIKVDIRSGKNGDGPSIEREIRNYLSITYLKPLRDAESELSAGRGSRLAQILNASEELSAEENIKELIEAILEANEKIVESDGIKVNRDNISSYLDKIKFHSDSFHPAIEIAGDKEYENMTLSEKKQAVMSILEKLSLKIDEEYPFQGLGYNNILFIATELLLLEREEGEFPLLVIEEPEAHLHPQLQLKLLKFIREDFCQTTNPKLQCILTTHSPNLASKAPLESLIIMTEGGKAFPLRKGETELAEDDYIFLEKFLDVTKSNMFFAKGVIIVEGDGENILLPTIAELVGRPLEDYGVSIVNVGSKAYARYAKVFKRTQMQNPDSPEEWMPIKVACLTDLDLWPNKAEKNDSNLYGFKIEKTGNHSYWLKYHTTETLDHYKNDRKLLDGQNVKVFLSNDWTFEYSLMRYGLLEEVYQSLYETNTGFDDLPEDLEDKCVVIMHDICDKKGSKTEIAYNLIKILQQKCIEGMSPEEMRKLLPPYLKKAIEYVTERFPETNTQA